MVQCALTIAQNAAAYSASAFLNQYSSFCDLICLCTPLTAQLSAFLSPDCNGSAIASALVAQDSTATAAQDPRERRHSVSSGQDAASYSEQFIQRIDHAMHRIDRAITEHVSEHHGSLLDQVGSVDGMQSNVTTVQSSVRHLKHAVHDLEALVTQQQQTLQSSIQKHRNVEKCGDLVRRLLRFHQLSDRVLNSSLNQTSATSNGYAKPNTTAENGEMVTLALAIREIESLTQDQRFQELSVVRVSLPTIRRVGSTMRRSVHANLRAGMEKLSQADVGDALQILLYLGVLSESVQTIVNDVIQELEAKCNKALAEENLVVKAASSSSATEMITQKADVWKAIQDMFEAVRVHALQVWNLQRVLVKMVDPGSGKTYLHLVIEPDEPTLFATFWDVSCAIIRELFASTLLYPPAVKNVVIASYPRMREEANRILNEMHATTNTKLDTEYILTSAQKAMRGHQEILQGIAANFHDRNQLLESMAALFDAFMAASLRQISTPIQLMFPQSTNFHTSPPSRSDMHTLSRTIYAELDRAGQDPVLIDGVLLQIHKAVGLFCNNIKRIMNTGKALTTMAPGFGRTPAQAHNVSLLNVLNLLDESIDEIASRVKNLSLASPSTAPAESGGSTQKALEALCDKHLMPCHDELQTLEYACLGQYLQSLALVLESMFAKMHQESFADQANGREQPQAKLTPSGSKFMAEFSGAFNVILEEHIKRLPNASFAATCVSDFVARLISVFIRHASMVRPLQENGKLRLANDMAQLELRLECILPLKTLGAVYDELRAFRHMVFLDNGSILRDSTVDKIRPSNVWHHLISRAPPELQMPHQMKRWAASKYIHWLDTAAGLDTRENGSNAFSVRLLPLGYPCLKNRGISLAAEREAWKEITKCLDAYAQRVSALPESEVSTTYDLLQESGAILLAGYEMLAAES